jgi:nucleoside-diphosphate-sugar epimerase
MNTPLHVVLGASGGAGQAVVAELKARGLPMRLVERSSKEGQKEMVAADLLKLDDTKRAVVGASHVYICVGLPYSQKIWRKEWPILMKNIIDACAEAGARIIFLDNNYMYGPAPLVVPMTEQHPQIQISGKGVVRREITDMLLKAHSDGRVRAVVGRSADFYGPKTVNSLLYETMFKRMLAGKAPQWLGNINALHSFSYTEDNGRALVALALDDETYGEVWHLPVNAPASTAADIAAKLNNILGTSFTIAVMPRPLLKVLSLFVPILREVGEMAYQIDDDYVFSDAKFRARFPEFKTTSLDEGLKRTVESFRS